MQDLNKTTPQPVDGQVGEAVRALERIVFAQDARLEEFVHWVLSEVKTALEALRTQPQAPVVEVPTVDSLEKIAGEKGRITVIYEKGRAFVEIDEDCNNFDSRAPKEYRARSILEAVALFQRTVGGGK